MTLTNGSIEIVESRQHEGRVMFEIKCNTCGATFRYFKIILSDGRIVCPGCGNPL